MSFIKIFSFKNVLLIYSLIIILINIVLIQLPLTSTFGFEFAATNGLIVSFISGMYTLKTTSRVDYKLSNLVISLLIISAIPLIIIIVYSLFTMFCSFCDGLGFYVLIVWTSIIFSCAIAFVIDILFSRLKRTIFIVVIFLVALIPILEIYFLPQVYFYSPIIGFFPGNIYDEGLSPDLKLFFHQLIVSIFSVCIIYLVFVYKQLIVKKKYYFISAIIISVIVFQFSSAVLGFNTTFSKLEKILPKVTQSADFTLHYDKLDELEAAYVALNTYYYYQEIIKTLKIKPSKQIKIYIFNSREQKKLIFGAGNADVAKPWQYAVYISADSWASTLKHELIHVFSAEFGTGPFKLSSGFNPALIEGIAEAIEGTTDEIALKDFSALAFNHNYNIDLNSLFSGFNFFKSGSLLAYTYSGAFIQFLIEKYGVEKVKRFYKDGDFSSEFSGDLDVVQKEFKKSLQNHLQYGNQAMADYYFGRLSILQKVCPRFISDRLSTAFENLEANKYEDAEKLFNDINSKSINYSAVIGLSEIYFQQKKMSKAIDLVNKNLNRFDKTPYYYNLKFRLADLFTLLGKHDSAKVHYASIIKNNPHHVLRLFANVRLSLLESDILKGYLNADDSTMYKLILQLSDSTYNYSSIPALVNLAERLKLNYDQFIKGFNKPFIVNDLESSYAAFKLSQFMLSNGDYINGRKYAAISLRFKDKNPFYTAMNENFNKAKWFYANASSILETFNKNVKKID